MATSGSFSRAAQKLLIGQPAISMQVAELEKKLGVRLLDRSRTGVKLTRAGAILYEFADRIVGMESAARRAIDDFKRVSVGHLSIGASTTVGAYLLPPILAAFMRQFPGIGVTVELGNTREIESKIADGLLDIGLTEGLVSEKLASIVFQHDELLVIAPAHGPLSKPAISMQTLLENDLILREVGSGTRAVFDSFLASRGLVAQPKFALSNSSAIKEFARHGLGRGVISALVCREEIAAGHLIAVKVADFSITRPLHLVRSGGVNPAAQAFERLLHPATGGRSKVAPK